MKGVNVSEKFGAALKVHRSCVCCTLAALCALVYSGGFFWQACIVPLALLLLAFVFCRKEINLLCYIPAFALMFLGGIALFFTRGNFQSGLYELEKMLLFVSALCIGSAIKKETGVLSVIYVCALVLAFAGLLAYIGVLRVPDYVLQYNGIPRLQSFLQYANTTACILGAGYYACLEIYAHCQNKVHLYLGAVLLLALYLTVSKAMIPLFLLCGTAMCVRRTDMRVHFAHQNVFVALFAVSVMYAGMQHWYFPAFVLMCIAVAVAGGVVCIRQAKQCFALWLTAMAIGIILVVLLMVFKPEIFYSFNLRTYYARDAFQLLRGHLWFGNGPGSWKVLQYAGQTSDYSVADIHNGLLQFAVEYGLLFTLGFIGLYIAAFILSLRKKAFVGTTVLALFFLHSFLDFDFSFALVLMILGLLVGHFAFGRDLGNVPRPAKVIRILFSGILVCCLMYMTAEYGVRMAFERDCLHENYAAAEKKADILEILCPKDSVLYLNRAALAQRTQQDTGQIRALVETAVKLSPYDADCYEAYIRYYATAETIEEMCRDYIKMKPRHERTYKTVNSILEEACADARITFEEKTRLVSVVDEIRFQNAVYDRNELLDRIMKEKGSLK